MFIHQYPRGRNLILFFSSFLSFRILTSFEVGIPWQTENHYSLLGNCKYSSYINIFICDYSPRQEHTYLPRLAFCIPWHHLRCPSYIISGISNHSMQNYFVYSGEVVLISDQNECRSSLFSPLFSLGCLYYLAVDLARLIFRKICEI